MVHGSIGNPFYGSGTKGLSFLLWFPLLRNELESDQPGARAVSREALFNGLTRAGHQNSNPERR
jgi:hypothetical protein